MLQPNCGLGREEDGTNLTCLLMAKNGHANHPGVEHRHAELGGAEQILPLVDPAQLTSV